MFVTKDMIRERALVDLGRALQMHARACNSKKEGMLNVTREMSQRMINMLCDKLTEINITGDPRN